MPNRALTEEPEPDSPDQELLAGLFDADAPFRHRMGLRRCEAKDFYADTAAGAILREEKRQILAGNLELYMVSSTIGIDAAREFADLLEMQVPPREDFRLALSLAVEPDLLFVVPPAWTLEWASVCFPTRWSLEGKFHEPLSAIHAEVPELNEQIGGNIRMFFDRLRSGEGWRRANWGLSASTQRNQHPSLTVRRLDADTPVTRTYVRVEDQHLLKLPRTGAIAFGIRIAHYRLSEILDIPGVGAGLEQKLRTMPDAVRGYKGISRWIAARNAPL